MKNRNAGLSWICHTLSAALADNTLTPPNLNSRHPDFASMAVRIGRAMNRESDAITALKSAEIDKSLFNIENDWIASVVLSSLNAPFTGTAAELKDRLIAHDPSLAGKLSAKRLGKRMSSLWPHFETVFKAERKMDAHTRTYTFTLNPHDGGNGQLPPDDTDADDGDALEPPDTAELTNSPELAFEESLADGFPF